MKLNDKFIKTNEIFDKSSREKFQTSGFWYTFQSVFATKFSTLNKASAKILPLVTKSVLYARYAMILRKIYSIDARLGALTNDA